MHHTGTQTLETQRLILRRYVPGDAEAMYRNWATDPEVARWLRWQPHANIGETRAVLQNWISAYEEKDDFYLWAIQRRADGALMGSIGVSPSGEAALPGGAFEPAYCLGRAFWGQGYATEALRAVVDYFFAATGMDVLYCNHAKQNPASGRVMQHIGFAPLHEGVYHTFNGTPVPAIFYRLYRKDVYGT